MKVQAKSGQIDSYAFVQVRLYMIMTNSCNEVWNVREVVRPPADRIDENQCCNKLV